MHQNVGLNLYSFSVLFSNNFSKWVSFGYGEMCTILPYFYLRCDGDKTCIDLASQVLHVADIEQLTVN